VALTREHAAMYNGLYMIVNNLARFAVPFFLVISGYFWGIKIRTGTPPMIVSLSMVKKLMAVFLFWNFVYLIPFDDIHIHTGLIEILKLTRNNIIELFHGSLLTLVMQGTKAHLWFLVSLLFALAINTIFIYYRAERSLIGLALALYIFGVLAKSYIDTSIGFHFFDFNTRNGPFFGTLPFTSGYFMSGLKTNQKWLFYGVITFTVGVAIHFSEICYLYIMYDTFPIQDYVFGTFLMGIGAALIALSDHQILQIKFLSRIGQWTLGIYAIHIIFVDLFMGIPHSPVWEIGYVLVVFALSTLCTYILSRYNITKQFIM
jgi:surface polysaccharide O-acyltransferase-like enzyme